MQLDLDELRERARECIELYLADDPVPFLEWLGEHDQIEVLLKILAVLSKHSRREGIYADDGLRDTFALRYIQAVINGPMNRYVNEKVEEAVA